MNILHITFSSETFTVFSENKVEMLVLPRTIVSRVRFILDDPVQCRKNILENLFIF